MPGADGGLGKKAEAKIQQWLDKPQGGYSFDRIPDQMTGHYLTSRNICDFICFKSPYIFYIESKATWHDRWDFSSLTEFQYGGLLNKSKIDQVFGLVVVLFASYKQAVILRIEDIEEAKQHDIKSINIKKKTKWDIPFIQIPTVANNRKQLLDYAGDLVDLITER